MSSNSSIFSVKRPWGRELFVSLLPILVGIFYFLKDGQSLLSAGLAIFGIVAFVVLYFRRLLICTKVYFDNEQVTMHFNQKAICLRYIEIERVSIIEWRAKKPVRIIFYTNSHKSYSLPPRYFDLARIQAGISTKLKSRQLEVYSVFFPPAIKNMLTFFKSRVKLPKSYRPFFWQDFLPNLRFTSLVQIFLVLATLTVAKGIEENKTKEIFASNQSEMLLCQNSATTECVSAATERAKFYFKVEESGFSSINNEPMELSFEHRLVMNILDRACENKVGDSCFLLSLIHAKIDDWTKSLSYFERSLEHSKGQQVSRLGENVPSEEYYASRYQTFNKGSRVLASDEYKELAGRHRNIKIEVTQ